MTWEDDWPVINGGQNIKLKEQGPGMFLKAHNATWRDKFQDEHLGLGWYRKSNFSFGSKSLNMCLYVVSRHSLQEHRHFTIRKSWQVDLVRRAIRPQHTSIFYSMVSKAV
jgi:hypothetical protein